MIRSILERSRLWKYRVHNMVSWQNKKGAADFRRAAIFREEKLVIIITLKQTTNKTMELLTSFHKSEPSSQSKIK
jgi:hypothetical protein